MTQYLLVTPCKCLHVCQFSLLRLLHCLIWINTERQNYTIIQNKEVWRKVQRNKHNCVQLNLFFFLFSTRVIISHLLTGVPTPRLVTTDLSYSCFCSHFYRTDVVISLPLTGWNNKEQGSSSATMRYVTSVSVTVGGHVTPASEAGYKYYYSISHCYLSTMKPNTTHHRWPWLHPCHYLHSDSKLLTQQVAGCDNVVL